jgi:hypothetical protein
VEKPQQETRDMTVTCNKDSRRLRRNGVGGGGGANNNNKGHNYAEICRLGRLMQHALHSSS